MTIQKQEIENRIAALNSDDKEIASQISALEARLDALKRLRERTAGALQDCQHWLAVIAQPEPAAQEADSP